MTNAGEAAANPTNPPSSTGAWPDAVDERAEHRFQNHFRAVVYGQQ